MFIAAYPVWSTIVIAVDVIVIYAIVVHGRELKAYFAVRSDPVALPTIAFNPARLDKQERWVSTPAVAAPDGDIVY
jgi:hypothetical protein